MLFDARQIRCGYDGTDVVTRADLHVDHGEALLIRGSNGSGKSTLLKALCGQIPGCSGEIRFGGALVGCRPFEKSYMHRDLYLVPQSRGVFDELTVQENIMIADRKGNASPGNPLLPELVRTFLDERRSARAGLLSGGQKKILAIAMAIASDAPLLFMDEPLAGLSDGGGLGGAVVELLMAAQRHGRALVIAEHREAQLVRTIEGESHLRIVDLAGGVLAA